MAKRIFIAATQQNDGKTTMSLGLMQAFKKRFKRIGFIKPIGQRYLIEQGYKVDEDSVLIEHVARTKLHLKDMSPVAIERGFTEKYIRRPHKDAIAEQIKRSFSRVAKSSRFVIIEGTGHAGVGACFDYCNAAVAKLLDSKVLMVTGGGIGRPIDEIILNRALFEARGVEVLGVIVNKVQQQKYKKINKLVRKGFERKSLEVLGVLPYTPSLSAPTVNQICETLNAELIAGAENMQNPIEHIIIGAMSSHGFLKYVSDRSLIITGGDREDIVLAAMSNQIYGIKEHSKISGIVFTGGMKLPRSILNLIRKADIPTLRVRGDTYTAAKKIHDRTVKIRPEDKEKIKIATEMVEKYIDIDKIFSKL